VPISLPARITPRDLPEIVSGLRIRQMTPFGNMHVKITVDPHSDRELEVFAQLGKGGDVATSDLEAICRMISLWLRSGGALQDVIRQLEGIGSSLQIPTRSGRIMSLGDGLATALKKYTRAKECFGLRSLLLGEIDPTELDNPHRPPHTPERTISDRTLASERAARSAPSEGTEPHRGRMLPETRSPAVESRLQRPRAVAVTTAEMQVVKHALAGPSDILVGGGAAVGAALAEPLESETHVSDEIGLNSERAAFAAVSQLAGVDSGGGNGEAHAGPALDARPRQAYDKAAHYKLKCPECGGALTIQEGCRKCHGCGWAAC
jgi:hypothetical protein